MFLMVENDPHCPPGRCLPLLTAAGHAGRTLAAYRDAERFPDPAQLTGVIILGGEMGVHQTEQFPFLERVRAFMAATLEAGTPLLGICLGGQLLSQVAGGQVSSPSPHGEKGVGEVTLSAAGKRDPLFAGLPSPFTSFQLHNDSFTPPPGAVLLAASTACPAQAFRLGSHGYGVQFHPEVDPDIVACWGELSEPPQDLLTGFLAARAAFDAASRTMLTNFFSLAAAARLS